MCFKTYPPTLRIGSKAWKDRRNRAMEEWRRNAEALLALVKQQASEVEEDSGEGFSHTPLIGIPVFQSIRDRVRENNLGEPKRRMMRVPIMGSA